MKIIMLIGRHRSGKTKTINEIFDAVKGPNDQRIMLTHSVSRDDFEAEIIFNGRKIGFYSAGDARNDVITAISKYTKSGCDVLICANSFVHSLWHNHWLSVFLQRNYPQHIIIPIKVNIPIISDIISEIKN